MTADPHMWPPFPEPPHVRILRAKVAAIEDLCVKHKQPPRDGRIPIVQIDTAWRHIEEGHQ